MMRVPRWIIAILVLASSSLLHTADRGLDPSYTLSLPDKEREMPNALDVNNWAWSYWSGRYLITHNLRAAPNLPVLALFDSSGAQVRNGTVWFSSAAKVSVRGVTVDDRGAIFVSGAARSYDGALADFIAQLNPEGQVSDVVRTNPYLGLHLCTTAPGSVWALGYDRDARRNGSPNLMLRQFDLSKGEVRSTLDMNSVSESAAPLNTEKMSLFCNAHTVGAFLDLGNGSYEWIELNVNDFRLSTWRLPILREGGEVNGVAMTSDGHVYATVHNYSGHEPVAALFVLRKQEQGRATWTPVKGTFGNLTSKTVAISRLIGHENDELVYTAELPQGTVVRWSHVRVEGTESTN
jgi:hypothetical protein